MDDNRLSYRFVMREDAVYDVLTSDTVPMYIKEFVRALWYARVGTGAWQQFIPDLAVRHAAAIMHGDDSMLSEEQRTSVNLLTLAIMQLIERGVLPTKDTRIAAPAIRLLLDKIAADNNSIAWAEYVKSLNIQS